MTDPVPSKEQTWSDARIRDELRDYDPCLSKQHVEQIFAQALGMIERQQSQIGELSIHSAKWVTRALGLQQNIARITGEREPPHCVSCACGLPPDARPAVVAVIQDEITARVPDGAPPLAERITTALGAADLLWRDGEGPKLRYEEGLAILYGVNDQAVARVCDEVIDHSGALLGRVRALARIASEPPSVPSTVDFFTCCNRFIEHAPTCKHSAQPPGAGQ